MTGVRPIPIPPDEANLSAGDLWDKKFAEFGDSARATQYVAQFHGPPKVQADATAYNPGSASILGQIGRGARDLVVGAVMAPIRSAVTANRAASEQDAANAIAMSGGNPSSVERTVSPRQARDASLQTLANLVAPGMTGTGGRLLANAAIGASYSPDHPVFGAVAGAAGGELLHGAGKVASKTGSAVLDASGLRPASYAGTPTLGEAASRATPGIIKRLFADPSEFSGLPPRQGPIMPDALRGELPERFSNSPEQSRRYNGPEPEPPPPMTGRTLLRSGARALGVESAEQRAQAMILDAMRNDGLPLRDAVARVSAQTGAKPETLMDLAGQNTLGLGRGASMVTGSRAKNDIPGILQQRALGQHERIISDATALSGVPSENTRLTLDDILTKRNAAADEAGRPLSEMEPQRIPGLEELAGTPSMEAAEAMARTFAKEKRQSFPPIFQRIEGAPNPVTPAHYNKAAQELGTNDIFAVGRRAQEIAGRQPSTVEARPLSFQEVKWLKKAMDTNSRAAQRYGQASLGPQLQPMQSSDYLHELMGNTTGKFVKGADEAFSGYGDLRRNFGEETSNAEAVESGKDFLKRNPDDLEVEFQRMGPTEQEMFKRGALRSIQNYIEGKVDARDVTGGLSPTLMQRRLRLVFGDNFDQFGQLLAREARMNQSRNFMAGQSKTADKIAELANVAGFSLDDIANLATGRLDKLATKLLTNTARQRVQGYTAATADALSDRLLSGANGKTLPDVLNELNAFETNRFLRAAKRGPVKAASSAAAANTASRIGNQVFNQQQ